MLLALASQTTALGSRTTRRMVLRAPADVTTTTTMTTTRMTTTTTTTPWVPPPWNGHCFILYFPTASYTQLGLNTAAGTAQFQGALGYLLNSMSGTSSSLSLVPYPTDNDVGVGVLGTFANMTSTLNVITHIARGDARLTYNGEILVGQLSPPGCGSICSQTASSRGVYTFPLVSAYVPSLTLPHDGSVSFQVYYALIAALGNSVKDTAGSFMDFIALAPDVSGMGLSVALVAENANDARLVASIIKTGTVGFAIGGQVHYLMAPPGRRSAPGRLPPPARMPTIAPRAVRPPLKSEYATGTGVSLYFNAASYVELGLATAAGIAQFKAVLRRTLVSITGDETVETMVYPLDLVVACFVLCGNYTSADKLSGAIDAGNVSMTMNNNTLTAEASASGCGPNCKNSGRFLDVYPLHMTVQNLSMPLPDPTAPSQRYSALVGVIYETLYAVNLRRPTGYTRVNLVAVSSSLNGQGVDVTVAGVDVSILIPWPEPIPIGFLFEDQAYDLFITQPQQEH
jgi:hypothetical protein